ncbi:UPF0182 family protein [Desulfohalovibrio reitneri]|uniref:UPF0182 family membrane protein n=1 Tax=Desulfohalovibrio reitneri TaxID=1307759 RepID=UPI000691C867|nr:UPF0182 family protein [Desulfohalovibrio reitneri]
MYIAIFLALMAVAGFLVATGKARGSGGRLATGVILGLGTLFLFWFMGFWGEFLWFESLGYEARFWDVFLAQWLSALGGGAAALLISLGLTSGLGPLAGPRGVTAGACGLAGLFWGAASWETILLFLNRAETPEMDPILGMPVSFYLFSLPLLDALVRLLFTTALFSLAGSAFFSFRDARERAMEDAIIAPAASPLPLARCAGAFLLVLGAGRLLERYHLLHSSLGTVNGAGWTDVNIRMPSLLLLGLAAMAIGAVLLIGPARQKMLRLTDRLPLPLPSLLKGLAATGAVMAVLWIGLGDVLPGAFQWLRVEPNEITFEEPYIEHNIAFTRKAFGLDRVEEREFPAKEGFTQATVDNNRDLFANIRLWDWRALDSVYKQFQEIRLYYEFVDVDIDRYHFGGDYRQVMVSAREMEVDNLPEGSQTFVNRRFKYTHGYGLTMTGVSEFTPQGLPDLLIKDIPPVSTHPELEVKRPQIYYGELTDEHVIANSSEQEFDYPKGEENAYIDYPGTGGVELSNLWRKFLFGWKFDGTKLFLSGYPTKESRILFRRTVRERVQTLAPFLHLDDDPYTVLSEGRMYWILDAYTTSDDYPYSEPFAFGGQPTAVRDPRQGPFFRRAEGGGPGPERVNYVRNSVKVVVDAFNGSVDLYVFTPDDPLIRAWDNAFPGLFKPRSEMPDNLEKHVRYPQDMLLLQGMVYAKYHMTNPAVFYNQEDLWVRATEKYYGQVQPVQPYYIMWRPPGEEELEFVLIQPFTPKNRQVLIGWIAGMCDGENYGRFLAYKFPKEKRVLGPQQVETKIDQDRWLSSQLSLWDQRGSRVIRGNVLAIPVDQTLLYVEPIYLQAETAAYPELRLVAVMHGDDLSYADSFEEALRGLFGDGPPPAATDRTALPGLSAPSAAEDDTVRELVGRASEAFQRYLDSFGRRDYQGAANALDRLESAIQSLDSRFASANATSERQP